MTGARGTSRGRRALRVLGGSALMLAFVGAVLWVLASRAGDWGVPYFSFTSANGSPCRNELAGYTCTSLTPRDVELFGDVDLPAGTEVLESRYRSTHDYELSARLRVPAEQARAALTGLTEAYGRCRPGAGSTGLSSDGLDDVCVMASVEAAQPDGAPSSRIWEVATGLDAEGRRLVELAVRSR